MGGSCRVPHRLRTRLQPIGLSLYVCSLFNLRSACSLHTNFSAALEVFYAIPFAGTKVDWLNNQLKPWSGFSRGEASYIDVPGEHHTLMDLEHVPQFQKIFRSRLEARGL